MITNEMKEYVKQGNVQMVRKELLAILNSNPDLGDGSFIANLDYAQKELASNGLFDNFSGGFEMQKDKNTWNAAYVAKIFLQLRREFSKEIIMHLIEVAPVAYHEKAIQRDLLMQTSLKTRELQKEESDPMSSLRGNCVNIVKWAIKILVIAVIAAVIAAVIVLGLLVMAALIRRGTRIF